jgi:hypothetical protein
MKDLSKYNVLDCGHDFLHKRLHKIGFKCEKCATNRKIFIERPDVAVWRTHYFHKIKKHKRQGKNIIYVDEMYVQQSHSVQSCWKSEEEPGVLTKMGTGQRLIVVHGGGQEEGFVC